MKVGRANELAQSHSYIIQWVKALESAIVEQQKIFVQQGNIDQSKIGFYIISMPSEQISSICVIYLMRYLMEHFVNNTSLEADKMAQIREAQDFQHSEVKIPSVQLFTELGRYFDRQLKQQMTDSKLQGKKNETFDP
jgi:hypothetical protein